MANNNTLKSDIRQYIYSNQNEEITGNILRDVLLEMVDSLGDGWTYKGVATTSTNPGTPDDNVFYIATAPGTYTNFGGLSVVDGEVAILKYNGSWAKDVTGAATSAQVTQLGQDVEELGIDMDKNLAYDGKSASYFNQLGGILITGARGGSSNYHNYFFANNGYTRVRVYAGALAGDSGNCIIAFYSATSVSTANFISGVAYNGVTGYAWYEAAVPANCQLIVIAPKDVPYPNYEVYLVKPLTTFSPFITDAQKTLHEKTDTGLQVQLKNCLLYYGLTATGQLTTGYPMSTHPIRVKGGQTINFTYRQVDVDGTLTDIKIRVAFYANKHFDSYLSVAQSSYASLASCVVPDGANYMRISLDIGSKYTRSYYTDGDLTIGYASEDFLFDIAQQKKDTEEERYGRWKEIRNVDCFAGSWQTSNGAIVHGWGAAGVCTKEPLIVSPGDYITMKRPNENTIYYFGGIFCDKDMNSVKVVTPDNFDEYLVPSNARYFLLNIRDVAGSVASTFDSSFSFFFNVSPRPFYENEDNIITQNNPTDEVVKLLNLRQPARVNGTLQRQPLSLLFFSDIHGNEENLARIVAFNKHYNSIMRNGNSNATIIDAMLCGGDQLQTYFYSGAFDYWANVPDAKNILLTIGNHDAMADAALTTFASKTDVYNMEFAPYVSNWGVTQPTGAATNGLMYYYKDFSTQKIRLIVLDCMYWDSAQLSWFESALSGAKSAGYSVVGVSHYPIGNTSVIPCNFTSRDYAPTSGARLLNPIAAVDSFISGGGEFICWLSGHTHADGFGSVVDHAGQLNLIVDAANLAAQDAVSVDGNKTQDCFNIIGFDTYSKLIKVMRVGRNYDRYLRHIGEMCVKYDTKEVLYTR